MFHVFFLFDPQIFLFLIPQILIILNPQILTFSDSTQFFWFHRFSFSWYHRVSFSGSHRFSFSLWFNRFFFFLIQHIFHRFDFFLPPNRFPFFYNPRDSPFPPCSKRFYFLLVPQFFLFSDPTDENAACSHLVDRTSIWII